MQSFSDPNHDPAEITIRPAAPAMAPVAGRLIHLTIGRVADYLFGGDDPVQAEHILGRLFRAESNVLSHQLADVALQGDQVAGLVSAAAWRTLQSLEIPTAFHMLRASGILGTIRMLLRSRPFFGVKEAENTDYFIAHVAVLPKFEGRGLGTQMLSHIESRARQAGFARLALTVDVKNPRAIGLYTRFGFHVIETLTYPTLAKRIGYDGFHRMVKSLA